MAREYPQSTLEHPPCPRTILSVCYIRTIPACCPKFHFPSDRRHMKVAKACRRCRIGKRRCDTAEPGLPCGPCTKRGLDCSLAVNPRRHPVSILPPPLSAAPVPGDGEGPLDLSMTLRLVNLYLEFIHNKPHTLFHTSSLLQAVEDGSIARHLLYSILALVIR